MTAFKQAKNNNRGFTLIELLVVIIIIAIISVLLIVTIKPAETVKKARDVQRMSDLGMIKSVIEYMLISSSTPYLAQLSNDCLQTGGSQAKIFYSYDADTMQCSGSPGTGTDAAGTFLVGDFCNNVTIGSTEADGTGWMPINFKWSNNEAITVTKLPTDPSNSVINPNAPTQSDTVYRYACQSQSIIGTKPRNVFEINATLESEAFTITNNQGAKDGGDNDNMYEVGNSLNLLPTTGNF